MNTKITQFVRSWAFAPVKFSVQFCAVCLLPKGEMRHDIMKE